MFAQEELKRQFLQTLPEELNKFEVTLLVPVCLVSNDAELENCEFAQFFVLAVTEATEQE